MSVDVAQQRTLHAQICRASVWKCTITNDKASCRPAIGVLQEERHHLNRVHQDTVPEWEEKMGKHWQKQPPLEEKYCLDLRQSQNYTIPLRISTHFIMFSKKSRALLSTWKRRFAILNTKIIIIQMCQLSHLKPSMTCMKRLSSHPGSYSLYHYHVVH